VATNKIAAVDVTLIPVCSAQCELHTQTQRLRKNQTQLLDICEHSCSSYCLGLITWDLEGVYGMRIVWVGISIERGSTGNTKATMGPEPTQHSKPTFVWTYIDRHVYPDFYVQKNFFFSICSLWVIWTSHDIHVWRWQGRIFLWWIITLAWSYYAVY
jgi:hypothetical protein